MASASSGGAGGGGGGPHPSASPSAAAGVPSSSSSKASLDGGFLLRILQNPPPQTRHQAPPPVAAAAAAGPQQVFVDPAVAAVGPAFPSAAPQLQHGGGFAWPSPASNPQPQLRFPDPRLAQPLDPYVALGYGGSGAVDGVAGSRAVKPRSAAPPPGFAKASHPPSSSSRETLNAFGGMHNREQRREPSHQHPRGFGRALEKEQRVVQPSAGGHEALGVAPPRELHTMQTTGGRDMAAGTMYREHQQRQDHFLSRTPPDGNGPGPFGRMPRGEQHMHSATGGRMHHGEQHVAPAVTGGRLPHMGQRPQDHSLSNLPRREQRWQGHGDLKGHASLKPPNTNVHGMFSMMSVKEPHQAPMPTSGSVAMDVREDRGKKTVAKANGLEDGVVGEVGFEHIVEGGVTLEARKFEVSYTKNDFRSIGQDEEVDDGNKNDDATIEQLMETLVIDDNGEAKSTVVQINGSRSKNFRSDSRGKNVSSQSVRFQRRIRPCRYDIDQFTPSFMSIFESLVPSDEEISKQKQLLATLSRLINKEWPNSKLYLYGSCANSFGFSNSDIDLCLSIDEKEMSKVDIILKLAHILHAGNLRNIQALTRARVPIVKLMDPNTGLSCDICVNNLLAVVNTKLLRDYSQIDKRLRPLAFIVKHWAKSRCVNETYQGTLSSYAYVIMCIHYLQSQRILPCLQEMEPTYYVTVDNNICAYFDQVDKLNGFGAQCKDTLSRLLWGFFRYWAYAHNYTKDVISIRTGRSISKNMKDWTRRIGNDRHLICIEDPFETSHDLGRVVDNRSIWALREEFERAAEILHLDPNPNITLFEPYVPSEAET
ncbi:uncharacterized protein LOC127752540 [Oryza glaberrima]|nr:uncharacterized protein LOC127752540 [Oryza glaberrima]